MDDLTHPNYAEGSDRLKKQANAHLDQQGATAWGGKVSRFHDRECLEDY